MRKRPGLLPLLGIIASLIMGSVLSARLLGADKEGKRSGRDGDEGPQTEHQEDKQRSVAEWTTLGVSAAILLATAGLVLYSYVVGGAEPARFEVSPRWEELREEGGLHYLPVEVVNRGDLTAEEVQVKLSLSSDGEPSLEAEFTIQFLAGGATAEAVVAFPERPSPDSLSIDGVNYLKP